MPTGASHGGDQHPAPADHDDHRAAPEPRTAHVGTLRRLDPVRDPHGAGRLRAPAERDDRISLNREPATDPAHRIGSLVINPGGPGEAGTQLLGRDLGVLTPATPSNGSTSSRWIHAASATAVASDCNDGDTGRPRTARHRRQSRSRSDHARRREPRSSPPTAGTRQACARAAGPLLGFIGTTDVARDLEQLRKAVGDERLTFLGISYGTLVGATYADLFPTHVRALVLDGVIDPSLPTFELWMAQAVGFQQQLDAFFASCGSGCAWRPGIPLARRARPAHATRPHAAAPGRGAIVGVSELYTALFSRLYEPLALGLARRRRWAPRSTVTAARSCRSPAATSATPGATINADASNAINCLDHPVDTDLSQYDALAAQAAARARALRSVPRVGRGDVRDVAGTADAPAPSGDARRAHRPTLVIGTTNDAGDAVRVGAERRRDASSRVHC